MEITAWMRGSLSAMDFHYTYMDAFIWKLPPDFHFRLQNLYFDIQNFFHLKAEINGSFGNEKKLLHAVVAIFNSWIRPRTLV